MSTVPRRSNSTNPRPGGSAFPKVPRSNLASQPLDLKRSNTTAGIQQSRPDPYASAPRERTDPRSILYSPPSTRERADPRAPLSPIPSSGSRSTPYTSAQRERTDLRSSAAPRPLQTAQALNRRPPNAIETTGHRRRPSLGGESIGQFASNRRPSVPEYSRRPSAPTHTRRPSGPTYQPQPQSQSYQHTRRPSAAQQERHTRRPFAPGGGGGGGDGVGGGAGGIGGRPPITQQVDQATKTQINQTYAVTMMASPYNPLPFFLPIPLGIAMLLTPSGKDRNKGPAVGTGVGSGPAPMMRRGMVGERR
ncbi:hypothetical protein QBC36DRAFT_352415 [Triangularia setosa]|uniref:Uncharacterized protein n=1 Tax=Triangularia setosa TaxID=2587417 RepID=A0AAN6W6Q3_9PEZI|nr:hypothetical protein QBC36DRAFT_352415 [Podospora setosa]